MQNTINFATIYRTARLALAVLSITLFAVVSANAQSTLVGWGTNFSGELNFPADSNRFVAVAAGQSFVLGLRDDGTVEAWGSNAHGECNVPAGLTGVVQVAANLYHSVALKSDGTVVCWGSNNSGESDVPAGLHNVVAVTASDQSSIALLADGTVVDWGFIYNPDWQVPNDAVATAIAGGHLESFIVRPDGTVGSYGLYSNNGLIPNLSGIKAVTCGFLHGAALRTDGTVQAWWYTQDYGQANVPAGLSGVTSISAGDNFTMALKSDGTVACWGNNSYGQCNVPVGLHDITSISAGATFSLALSRPPLNLTASVATFYSGSTATVKATARFAMPSASPRVVTFTSSDPSAVAAPSPVTIPAGATTTTFVLSHMPVTAAKTVTITATSGALSHDMPLVLQPIYVKTVSFDHNNSEGGISFTGSLTLNVPVKKSLAVTLTGDSPSYLNVQSSTTVAASNATALFSLSTSPVPANTTVHVSALAGGAPFVASLNIIAQPKVKDFKLTKSSIFGNQKTIGTFTLSAPAGQDGLWVGLYINGPDCSAPGAVFVPKGQTKGTVEITGLDVSVESTTPISARTDFSEVVRPLTVSPMVVQAVSLSPAAIQSGETSIVTVTLVGPVAFDTTVDLLVVSPNVANLPATLTIPAGSKVGTVTLTANATATVKRSQIQGGRLGVSKSKLLIVNP